jgi:hypothetical protein
MSKLCELVEQYLVDGEEARDIEGYEGLYCVTNYGRVFSGYNNRFLKANKNLVVALLKDKTPKMHSINTLVIKAFIPNAKGNYDDDSKEWYIDSGILHYKDKEKDDVYQQQFMTQKEMARKIVAEKLQAKDDGMMELIARLELRDYKYKELCDLLDDNIKGGRSKICQINNWKRFFRWENPTSHIYRVVEIYDAPLEKVDMRRKIYRDKQAG